MSKRELVEPTSGDKRLQRRDNKGRFAESDDLGKSLARDQQHEAAHEAPRGEGDKGDRKH